MTEQEVRHRQYMMGGYPPQDLPDLPEGSRFADEWRAYKREVLRLLAEGHAGRYVLVKGDQVLSVWDTLRDARQAGYERFGMEPFLVREIQFTERPPRQGYRRQCRTSPSQ